MRTFEWCWRLLPCCPCSRIPPESIHTGFHLKNRDHSKHWLPANDLLTMVHRNPKLRYIRRCKPLQDKGQLCPPDLQATTHHEALPTVTNVGKGFDPNQKPQHGHTQPTCLEGFDMWLTVNHIWQELKKPSYFFEFFPQNRFSYRGSYFKLGGEGSQILWIRCGGGAVTQGVVSRCRLVCVGGQDSQIQDRAVVTQGVIEAVIWCVYGWGFADSRPGCPHTGCHWSCHLMRVGVRVCRSKRGLSQRVSLEVSSDACTGGGSQFAVFIFI